MKPGCTSRPAGCIGGTTGCAGGTGGYVGGAGGATGGAGLQGVAVVLVVLQPYLFISYLRLMLSWE